MHVLSVRAEGTHAVVLVLGESMGTDDRAPRQLEFTRLSSSSAQADSVCFPGIGFGFGWPRVGLCSDPWRSFVTQVQASSAQTGFCLL